MEIGVLQVMEEITWKHTKHKHTPIAELVMN
jgi:hypothetical protein